MFNATHLVDMQCRRVFMILKLTVPASPMAMSIILSKVIDVVILARLCRRQKLINGKLTKQRSTA